MRQVLKIVGQIFREHFFTIICFAVCHYLLFDGGWHFLYWLLLGDAGNWWYLWGQRFPFFFAVKFGLVSFLFGAYFSFFVLWEIAAYLMLYQRCYENRLAAFVSMVVAGGKQALGVCRRPNCLLFLYLLLVLPFQVVMTWSSLYLSVEIPHFILQFLDNSPLLLLAANLLLLGVQILGIEGLFFFHFLFLRGKSAWAAWHSSRQMGLWRLGQTVFLLCLWNLLWFLVSLFLYGGGVLVAFFLSSAQFALLLLEGVEQMLLLLQKLFFVPLSMGVVHSCYLMFLQGDADISCPKIFLRGGKIIAVCAMVIVIACSGWDSITHVGQRDREQKPGDFVIAVHRGYSATAPENTLAAIAAAKDIGVDCIEIDVQMTADGQLVLFHDGDLYRTLGVSKTLGQLTYAELRALIDKKYADVVPERRPFPLLTEALSVGGNNMGWNIEIKTYSLQTIWDYCRWSMEKPLRFWEKEDTAFFRQERAQKQQMAASVISLLEEKHLSGAVVISSLDYEVLQSVKAENPSLRTLYILPFVSSHIENLAAADGYSIEITALSPRIYGEIRKAGKGLWVWTVNDAAAAGKLFSYQVDGVITDRPLLLEKISNGEKNIYRQQFFHQFLFS